MVTTWQNIGSTKSVHKKVNANYVSLLQQSYEEIIIVTQV